MSREHFALLLEGTQCHVHDLNSSNGTLLNGERITKAVVHDGDEIVAGNSQFIVHLTAVDTAAAPAVPASTAGTAPAPPPAARKRKRSTARPPAGPAVVPTPGPAVETPPAMPAAAPAAEPAPTADVPATIPLLQIVNSTPYPATFMLWSDLEDHPQLTVIVKVTLTFAVGDVAQVAAEQLPLLVADEPNGDGEDTSASIRFESDMVPFKPKADVVLVGKVHAPGGQPAPEVDVSMRVGKLSRRLRVFGDRQWLFATKLSLLPKITPPEPFVTMDLVYERSFGGIDGDAALYCKENLVGVGFIGKVAYQTIHETRLPNIEDPQNLITSPKIHPKPVGFGFCGRGWMPRAAYAGTYDDRYREERSPALPLDRSMALYNGAHPDLQVEGYLRGDESIKLENLGNRPRVTFRLPRIVPRLKVSKWEVPLDRWQNEHPEAGAADLLRKVARSEENVPLVLDTLVLEPEEDRLYLVFRGVTTLTDLNGMEVAQMLISQ